MTTHTPWLTAMMVIAFVAEGCDRRSTLESPSVALIPPGAVALCAGQAITSKEVENLADRQHITPQEALELAEADARFAEHAQAIGLAHEARTTASLRAAEARALLTALKAQVSSAPLTAEELQRVRQEHWMDLDRPETVSVVHAVALASKDDATKRTQAQAVAQAIAIATQRAQSAEEFRSRAEQVPHDGVEVQIETLPPLTRDGRAAGEGGGQYDEDFVAAAHRLQTPNEQSPPVSTRFGVHVIHLLEHLGSHHVPDDELRGLVHDEVIATRAHTAMASLLTELHGHEPVSVARNAEELVRSLDHPVRTP